MRFILISIFLVQYSLEYGEIYNESIHNTYFCLRVYETAHSKPIHTAAWLELNINKTNWMFAK